MQRLWLDSLPLPMTFCDHIWQAYEFPIMWQPMAQSGTKVSCYLWPTFKIVLRKVVFNITPCVPVFYLKILNHDWFVSFFPCKNVLLIYSIFCVAFITEQAIYWHHLPPVFCAIYTTAFWHGGKWYQDIRDGVLFLTQAWVLLKWKSTQLDIFILW